MFFHRQQRSRLMLTSLLWPPHQPGILPCLPLLPGCWRFSFTCKFIFIVLPRCICTIIIQIIFVNFVTTFWLKMFTTCCMQWVAVLSSPVASDCLCGCCSVWSVDLESCGLSAERFMHTVTLQEVRNRSAVHIDFYSSYIIKHGQNVCLSLILIRS